MKTIMYSGVNTESILFICLWLVEVGAFHFDSLLDSDYLDVCAHLDSRGIKYEVKSGNRKTLHLITNP